MNVLVLGGNGFIGSHVIDCLVEAGQSVRVYDRSPEKFRAPLDAVDYCVGDFSDTRRLERALTDIDTVIHLVSTTVPATSNEDPGNDIAENLIPTIGLLDAMVRHQTPRIIFFSSGGTVYGRVAEGRVAETAALHPICSYAVVKLAVESYLNMYSELYGLKYVSLRVANPYGQRQGHVGVQGVIGTFMNRIRSGEEIEIWGDGSVERDYVHVTDVARACLATLEGDAQGVFNIGSGTGCSLNDIVKKLELVTGTTIHPRYRPGRPYDVPRIVLDCRKAAEILGWKPQVDMSDGLAMCWRWLCEQ